MFTIITNKTALVLLGAFLALLVSCASSPLGSLTAPDWITNTFESYPDSEYLSAVGFAQDRTTAEAEAVSNLSKILKQRVESTSTASQSFEENFTTQNREYETTVKTSSLIDEITGIKIQEVWTARDNTTYALALINRKEVGTFYAQKIKENESSINALLTFMIDNEATFAGVSSAGKALQIAYQNEAYLELLSVINPTMYKNTTLAYKSATAISVLLQLEKEKIYVDTYITGDVDGRVSNALSESFKAAGYKSGVASSFPIPSVTTPYVLYGELIISPFEMSSSQNNKYVRFTLNTELVGRNNQTFFPWSISGREAHLSEDEAAQRAIRTIEEKIEKEFLSEVYKLSN